MYCYIFGYYPLLVVFLGLTCFHSVLPSPNVYWQNLESALKCHPALTIEVLGEATTQGLRAYGYHFSEGYYKRINLTHFRVCICKVTKCIRKCCGQGQALYNRSCIDGYDFPLHPDIYDKDFQLLYNYDFTKFVTVYGDTCSNGRFTLRPDIEKEDLHFFLENGSLYLPNDLESSMQDTEDFCFEHVLQKLNEKPNQSSIRTMICFPDKDSEPVSPLLPIGMIISIPFLLATFLVYSLPELRNLHGKNLMSHVGSLFLGYIFLVVVQMASTELPNDVCIAFGYLIQYSFLSSFFWLNVMCFDIWWAFSGFASLKGEKRSTDTKKYLMYSTYAWGCPAVITIATIVMQFAPGIPNKLVKPDIGDHRCFFTSEKAKLAYFYGPTAIILLCDVILFILTAVKIISVKKQTVAVFRGKDSGHNREASKQRYKLYLKLFLIMGVNWTMEVISWAAQGPKWVWYFTDLANTLQGALIFTLFVLNAKIKTVVSNRLSSQTLKSFISRESTNQPSRVHKSPVGNSPSHNAESR